MKKYILFILMLTIVSCNEERLQTAEGQTQLSTNNKIHVCTAKEKTKQINQTGRVSYKGTYWQEGQTIRIKFLNGDPYVQSKVKEYASKWLLYANLKFDWVASDLPADIKIAFKWYGDTGSWSIIGKSALNIMQDYPTMNFGWFDENTIEEEFSRVVLHEFGHAFGLGHELQNPNASIQWNKEVVYWVYERSGWSRDMVDAHILNKFDPALVDYTNFDDKSIMLYSFPADFTLNGYSVSSSTVLSDEDKRSIGMIYPFPKVEIKEILYPFDILKAGESITSRNNRFKLIMQTDGNFVIYDLANGKSLPIWSSKTVGKLGSVAKMQTDGNLVIYQGIKAVWHTNTAGKSGAYTTMQDDGILTMYRNGKAIWSSKKGRLY